MKYLALFLSTWIAWLPVTYLFGRVFCRWCCPVGLSQSLVHLATHPKTHVRRVCTRLPRPWHQKCVNWTILLAYFTLPVGAWLHPWGIFGRVLVCFVPGIVFFAAVLALALFAKGRIWCNWICPLGTMFDFVAKIGLHSDAVARGCAHCRRCFPVSAPPGEKRPSVEPSEGVGRREVVRGVALLAAAELVEKTTDGGFAPVSLPGAPSPAEREKSVLPPGAVTGFATACVGCGICTRVCPEKILKPSAKLATLGHPTMDFRYGFCRLACEQKCARECPVGALKVLDGVKHRDIHLGQAVWKKDLCIRTTQEVECTACVRKCPVRAIHLVEGYPVVDATACIGCGACEHVCPARPMPAIFVRGFGDRQRVVRPMPANDSEIIINEPQKETKK